MPTLQKPPSRRTLRARVAEKVDAYLRDTYPVMPLSERRRFVAEALRQHFLRRPPLSKVLASMERIPRWGRAARGRRRSPLDTPAWRDLDFRLEDPRRLEYELALLTWSIARLLRTWPSSVPVQIEERGPIVPPAEILASRCNASLETCGAVLAQFHTAGLVTVSKNRLTFVDRVGLGKLGVTLRKPKAPVPRHETVDSLQRVLEEYEKAPLVCGGCAGPIFTPTPRQLGAKNPHCLKSPKCRTRSAAARKKARTKLTDPPQEPHPA